MCVCVFVLFMALLLDAALRVLKEAVDGVLLADWLLALVLHLFVQFIDDTICACRR